MRIKNDNSSINAFGNDTFGISFGTFSVFEADSGSSFGVFGNDVGIGSLTVVTTFGFDGTAKRITIIW